MNGKRYRRYFIILDHEDEGFQNIGGKQLKGYTKIETKNGKGVLNHYIQNIKYFDQAEYVYKGYLIGTKEGKQICADNGALAIDENGKGELNWKFDAENVDGQGNSIRDFNVIAIVAKPVGESVIGKDMAAPLVGFIDKERVAWKHVLANQYKEEKREHKQEEKVQQTIEITAESHKEETEKIQMRNVEKEEKEIEVASLDVKEEIEEIEPVKESINIAEKIAEEVVEKEEKIEEMKRSDPQPVNMKEEVLEKKMKQETLQKKRKHEEKEHFVKGYRSEGQKDGYELEYGEMKFYDCKNPYGYYGQYFKMVCGYVENTLKYYKEAKPFEKNIGNCKWWKMDCNQQTLYRNFLPFYGYVNNMHGNMPYKNHVMGCPHLIYKYQHYIFGIIRDENDGPMYYLYGMPGRFMANEQPDEGVTGFVYWHPIEDKKAEKGDYGYWILHIDAKTGNVAVPLRPTIPPR
ncbi:DUF7922 domain-containing protein [Marinisporobacter balticus]|uniref:DUF7922 domain-containing protein n=1 Tax=Marinisporobacter balticus TaxID=2018667 RepID=A0A4R2KZK0_9FIRM|nr:hypothetical protein [Marinisporobacter balticus]TCO78642.1 hypothetical protein EV214_10425 [Marinisporobacter balticus]